MIQVMKEWLILISIDMWQYHKYAFLSRIFVYPPEVKDQ